MPVEISAWIWSHSGDNEVESIEVIFFNSGNFVYIHTREEGAEVNVYNASGAYSLTASGICFPLDGDIVTGKYGDNTMTLTFSNGEALGGVFLRQ